MTFPQAVIEIGSTGIRLLVAEITEDNKRNILDRSELPVNIGRDVFTTGSISKNTLLSAQKILNRYGELLDSWQISRDDTTVVGTTAVREALNRDTFVDRIKIKTGFNVRVIDGIEGNRLMYIAVTECLKEEEISVRQSNSIILEIAGGATEMMLMEKGRMVGAHSMRLGTIIIDQQIRAMTGTLDDAHRIIEKFIQNTRFTLSTEMNLGKVQQFIALGSDMNLAALFAGRSISTFLWEIKRQDFENFVDEIQHYTEEECIAKFKLSYSEAKTFQLSLIAYKYFIQLTDVKSIIVPETSIREGILISQHSDNRQDLQLEFTEQIIASATTLLRKYQGDEEHAMFVQETSLRLYDAMEKELGLNDRARLLLQVSAILHDIGMFIREKDHNKHSKYIIMHSEIFGLSKEDVSLISNIAYFHKGIETPQKNPEIKMLTRENRLTILKLSAILRIADALDRGHHQNLKNFSLSFSKDTLTIRIKGHYNSSLEKLALAEKGDLFENVFGYSIAIV